MYICMYDSLEHTGGGRGPGGEKRCDPGQVKRLGWGMVWGSHPEQLTRPGAAILGGVGRGRLAGPAPNGREGVPIPHPGEETPRMS